jgi:type I restriction enzyme S subunit
MPKRQSRIEKLIAELCPEGVAFKSIGEICQINRGRVMSKDYLRNNAGEYPVYSSQTVDDGVFGRINTYDYDGEYLTWTTDGANAGSIFYRNGKFSITNVCGLLKVKVDGVNTKFLLYILGTISKKYVSAGMGNPKIMSNVMEKIEVPIPPLPIQQEIVKILDTFTTLEAELEVELEAELEARKKQYEYYRDELLTFGEDVEWKTLGEVGEFIRGKRFVKKDITSEGIPCIHYGEMYTHYKIWAKESKSYLEPTLAAKLRVARPGDVVIVAAGETVEDIGSGVAWLGESNVVIHDACFAFTHNLNPKYVSYYLQTDLFRAQIKRYISSAKISSINAAGLSKAKIPIPPLAEQERIVAILDKFDALVNDISIGLPAELNARRKQYEYYRNKLLTFEPLEKNHARQ